MEPEEQFSLPQCINKTWTLAIVLSSWLYFLLGVQSSVVITTDVHLGLALHLMKNTTFQQIMSPVKESRISSQILTPCDLGAL